ncbi:DNA integration/recombination/inversion protein [Octadecabacter antarcticus 307]|uniref:DNA integration/recombination/inversion protein n=1 Tax=Octadecabacter antarcticus 307 TaxID=391626 RepID=M9RA41_9RHOB|nr:site-specific integrase [Octadecabacter antarcticus]AGI68678.1 DNA integration/recombination/inversion protein [Octadecabacter antarcticus 307]
MPKLTKRFVENLPIKATNYFAWDDEVRGFGVRIMPSGVRTYQVQYLKGGRTRRAAIGRHGVLTAEQARAKAKDLLGKVAMGGNPVEEISIHRRASTVGALCDRFLEVHVLERCKPSTAAEYKRGLNIFIKPALGAFKVVDVKRKDIAAIHHKMKETPYQANRVLGVLSKMFNLAEVWGLRPDGSNPCRHVPKYRELKREAFLSQSELQRLGATLAACELDGSESPYIVAAFRLLILTGCRLGEIQTLKWEYLTAKRMELPDTKTGARRIPLPKAARDVLAALPRVVGNPYVVCGAVEGRHITDLQHPWRRVRERAGLPHTRIHDLRHTYASNAVSSGMPIQMVGKLLGHTQIQTTMRYAHLADDPVLKAAEENASSLQSALGIGSQPVNYLRVVP